MAGGDKETADRLIEYERERKPDASQADLIDRAIVHLRSDRRQGYPRNMCQDVIALVASFVYIFSTIGIAEKMRKWPGEVCYTLSCVHAQVHQNRCCRSGLQRASLPSDERDASRICRKSEHWPCMRVEADAWLGSAEMARAIALGKPSPIWEPKTAVVEDSCHTRSYFRCVFRDSVPTSG
jgi:hypothetical protein